MLGKWSTLKRHLPVRNSVPQRDTLHMGDINKGLVIVRRVVEARRQHYQAQMDYCRPQHPRHYPVFTIENTHSSSSPPEGKTRTAGGPRQGEQPQWNQQQVRKRFLNWSHGSQHTSNRHSIGGVDHEGTRSREEKKQGINRRETRTETSGSLEERERHRWRRRLGCFS